MVSKVLIIKAIVIRHIILNVLDEVKAYRDKEYPLK